MIRTADLAALLTARGITTTIVDTAFTAMPDLQVALVATGGPGTALEREFDQATIQVRVRGGQRDPGSAQQLMTQVDQALLNIAPPFQVAGRHVADVDYLGGPPAFLRRDEAYRDELVCNYRLMIARD